MLTLFVTAFMLGLLFNAAPGAVFAKTISEGAKGGFKPALAVQVGSLVGDALWAILGLLGIGLLLQLDVIRTPVAIAGIAYLLWLAWDNWQEAKTEFSVGEIDDNPLVKKALRDGMMLSLTNPQNIAYWAALGSAMGAVGVANPDVGDYGIFFAGFMVSSIVWCFFCAALVDQVFKRLGFGWAKLTYQACAVAFLYLAYASAQDLWQQTALVA